MELTDSPHPAACGRWETYFGNEGFESIYCHFDGLHALGQYGGVSCEGVLPESPKKVF